MRGMLGPYDYTRRRNHNLETSKIQDDGSQLLIEIKNGQATFYEGKLIEIIKENY